ncbi:MAG: tRNA 2-thiocytidine biosynthesis TtcA family protein [Bacilli bacterium]|nr:tRNA 2-thiocytidine biosynthesis TtcA family protein [Bacilli bacterium]
MKSIKTILGGIRQADQKYSLFNEKDRIVIGLSGGKDSMALLYTLNMYRKFDFVNFEIFPVTLDLGFPGFDAEPIKNYVESLGLKLTVVDSKEVYQVLKAHQKDAKHLPCSICSRMKKAAINKAAKDLRCNKVAFAHHADDAIETYFMNTIHGGRVATFQPKMYLERSEIEFIRPFIHVREDDIKALVKEENIPFFSSHCPNDGFTMRTEMKEMLDKIYEKYPQAKHNYLVMMSNYEKEILFNDDINIKIERKDIYFRPVINANDSLIETKIRLAKNVIRYETDLKRYVIFKKNKPVGIFAYRDLGDHKIEIVDLFLLRRNIADFKSILRFIEIQLSRKIIPLELHILDKEYKDIYLESGYGKTHINGFIKKFN